MKKKYKILVTSPRMSSQLKVLLIYTAAVVNTINSMNTTATFDAVYMFPQSWGVGNHTHFTMICTVTGSDQMWFKLNDEYIAHVTAGKGVGMEETFGTNGGNLVKTVILSVFNTADFSFSVLILFPVELGPDGYGTATCMSDNNRDDRIINATWNNGPSENCKTNGSMTLCYKCYNNAATCIFSCHGDQVLRVSLNGQILSEDPANITSLRCNPGNNTCSSKIPDFIIIENGIYIGMVSELGVLRCIGPDGYVEVNMFSIYTPVSMAPTPTGKGITPPEHSRDLSGRKLSYNVPALVVVVVVVVVVILVVLSAVGILFIYMKCRHPSSSDSQSP